MQEPTRKYKFNWDDTVGANIGLARPNLGSATRIETYRLFQFALRDVLEQHFGTEQTDIMFREAGVLAGKEFFNKFFKDITSLKELIPCITDVFKEFGIGIFRFEKAEEDDKALFFSIDEDLDCSGMPDSSDVVCVYDEGFLRGVLESISNKKWDVKEIDCWCSGARTCRFKATQQDDTSESNYQVTLV